MVHKTKSENSREQLFVSYTEKILAIYDRPERLLCFLNDASYNLQNYHPGFVWKGEYSEHREDPSFFIRQLIRNLVIPWMGSMNRPKDIIREFLSQENDYDCFERNYHEVSDDTTTIMGAFSKQLHEDTLSGEDIGSFLQGIRFLECLHDYSVALNDINSKEKEVSNG